MDPRTPQATRLLPFGTTIFSEMTALASRHHAINLAQGFPDFDGPSFLVEAACAALRSGQNQYARSQGLPDLTRAISRKLKRCYDLDVDPMNQVGVFSGATEGICAALLGLVDPGDEVILFEPFYDSYPACVAFAGGTVRICTLYAPDFHFDPEELEACFSAKTKLLILNTPHNPTGKVFTRDELTLIGDLCRKHGVYVLTDEVYEHLTFDGAQHIPMATLPGMWDYTLTLSSTGKTFSMTGWKIGYAVGPAPLVRAAQSAHQFITFATATPFQWAMVAAMDVEAEFYTQLRSEYDTRRRFLMASLSTAGLKVLRPAGTYFCLVDLTDHPLGDDQNFARFLTTEVGVACIPTSVFYLQKVEEGRRLVRFAFCKRQETLEAATQRLVQWSKT